MIAAPFGQPVLDTGTAGRALRSSRWLATPNALAAGRLMPKLIRLLRSAVEKRRDRSVRDELLGMDERMLRDMGAPDSLVMNARAIRADSRMQGERERLERLGW